jgi:hypothetical protein
MSSVDAQVRTLQPQSEIMFRVTDGYDAKLDRAVMFGGSSSAQRGYFVPPVYLWDTVPSALSPMRPMRNGTPYRERQRRGRAARVGSV